MNSLFLHGFDRKVSMPFCNFSLPVRRLQTQLQKCIKFNVKIEITTYYSNHSNAFEKSTRAED